MQSNHQVRFYYIKDVEQLIGKHRLTLRRWWVADKFPKPVLIGKRVAWPADVINQWLAEVDARMFS